MKKILLTILVGLLISLPASAALVNCGTSSTPECKIGDLITLIVRIINQLLAWSGLVAILFVFWAGWEMINAGGNSEGIENAKKTLSNAIIGFFFILIAMVLVNTIMVALTGYHFNFDNNDPKSIMKFLWP